MRYRVHMPVIVPAKHHLVDEEPVQFTGRVPEGKMIDWLTKRAKSKQLGLVPRAVYQGLLDRIRRGDFR